MEESKWDTVRELLEDKKLLKASDRTGLPVLHKAVVLGEADIAEKIAKEFVEALTTTDNVSNKMSLIHIKSINFLYKYRI